MRERGIPHDVLDRVCDLFQAHARKRFGVTRGGWQRIAAKEMGISQPTVSLLWRHRHGEDERGVGFVVLVAVKRWLGISMDELIGEASPDATDSEERIAERVAKLLRKYEEDDPPAQPAGGIRKVITSVRRKL